MSANKQMQDAITLDDMNEYIIKLKKQNERLREVLKFYGSTDNYYKQAELSPVYIDAGKTAREALKEE